MPLHAGPCGLCRKKSVKRKQRHRQSIRVGELQRTSTSITFVLVLVDGMMFGGCFCYCGSEEGNVTLVGRSRWHDAQAQPGAGVVPDEGDRVELGAGTSTTLLCPRVKLPPDSLRRHEYLGQESKPTSV